MAQNFTVTANTKEARNYLAKVKRGLTPSAMNAVVAKTAMITWRRLVVATPKKWTGTTRKGWQVNKLGASAYQVTNVPTNGGTPVMLFLEKGTKAHGPKRAKFLFIPRTRKAALAGARVVLANSGAGGTFKAGKHFYLAKRVRGMKAMNIVERERGLTAYTLDLEMRMYIRKLINSI